MLFELWSWYIFAEAVSNLSQARHYPRGWVGRSAPRLDAADGGGLGIEQLEDPPPRRRRPSPAGFGPFGMTRAESVVAHKRAFRRPEMPVACS
jgi:hypothetical protein